MHKCLCLILDYRTLSHGAARGGEADLISEHLFDFGDVADPEKKFNIWPWVVLDAETTLWLRASAGEEKALKKVDNAAVCGCGSVWHAQNERTSKKGREEEINRWIKAI